MLKNSLFNKRLPISTLLALLLHELAEVNITQFVKNFNFLPLSFCVRIPQLDFRNMELVPRLVSYVEATTFDLKSYRLINRIPQ